MNKINYTLLSLLSIVLTSCGGGSTKVKEASWLCKGTEYSIDIDKNNKTKVNKKANPVIHFFKVQFSDNSIIGFGVLKQKLGEDIEDNSDFKYKIVSAKNNVIIFNVVSDIQNINSSYHLTKVKDKLFLQSMETKNNNNIITSSMSLGICSKN